MKYSIILLACCFCLPNNIQATTTYPNTPPINLVLHITNSMDAKSQTNTIATPSNFFNTQEEPSLMSKMSKLLEASNIKDNLSQASNSFFKSYKWYALGGTIVGSYAYLLYFFVNGNHYLKNNNLWSSWKQEIPLDQLLAIAQQQLSQELLHEIRRRYLDSSNIADFVSPLAQFINEIEQEEEQLKWYQNMYSWIVYLKLTKLMPTSVIRFTKITERLQRIAYFKNVFKTWASDYQLEHIK